MSFMYKSIGAKHSNWQLSQNNQYVSYALLSLGGSGTNFVILKHFLKAENSEDSLASLCEELVVYWLSCN